MKIRNGFVSNSSSSSFVIIMRDDVRDKVLSELSPYETSLFNMLFSKRKFGNESVNFFSGRIGTEAPELLDCLGEIENEEFAEKDKWGRYNVRIKAFYNIVDKCLQWRNQIILDEVGL